VYVNLNGFGKLVVQLFVQAVILTPHSDPSPLLV